MRVGYARVSTGHQNITSKADKGKAVARYKELREKGYNKGQAAETAGKEFGVAAITIKRYLKSGK